MATLNNQRVIGAEMPDMKKWTKNEMPNAQEPAAGSAQWSNYLNVCSSLVNGLIWFLVPV
jgi:hypothetical protein